MISFFSPAALHALGFIALLFMHSFCASTVTFQFTRDICKTAPFAKPSDGRLYRAFSAFRCFKCVCKTQCSFLLILWRSRPTFMQTDFHASMKSVHKNVRVNCIIKRRPTILHCRPSNLSQRIPRTALLRDCRFQCLFTGTVCIPSLSEVFSKLLSCVCPFLKSTPDCIDNLSYSLLCVNTQNFYPVVIIAPRFRSPSKAFLHIASFF